MSRRAPLLSLLALAAVLFSALPARAAMTAYLILKSPTKGDVKSETTAKGHEGQIEVWAFTNQSDATTHNTFTITHDLDKSSPVLRTLFENKETLAGFELRLFRPLTGATGATTGTGSQEQYFSIVLQQAKIVGLTTRMLNIKDPALMKFSVQEEVTFTFSHVDYTYVKGGVAGGSSR